MPHEKRNGFDADYPREFLLSPPSRLYFLEQKHRQDLYPALARNPSVRPNEMQTSRSRAVCSVSLWRPFPRKARVNNVRAAVWMCIRTCGTTADLWKILPLLFKMFVKMNDFTFWDNWCSLGSFMMADNWKVKRLKLCSEAKEAEKERSARELNPMRRDLLLISSSTRSCSPRLVLPSSRETERALCSYFCLNIGPQRCLHQSKVFFLLQRLHFVLQCVHKPN